MAATGIGTALVTYMKERPKQHVTIDDLVWSFDNDYTRTQLMNNMNNLIASGNFVELEKIAQGVWRWTEVESTDQSITYSFVTAMKSGILVKDAEGAFYSVKPIDL